MTSDSHDLAPSPNYRGLFAGGNDDAGSGAGGAGGRTRGGRGGGGCLHGGGGSVGSVDNPTYNEDGAFDQDEAANAFDQDDENAYESTDGAGGGARGAGAGAATSQQDGYEDPSTPEGGYGKANASADGLDIPANYDEVERGSGGGGDDGYLSVTGAGSSDA